MERNNLAEMVDIMAIRERYKLFGKAQPSSDGRRQASTATGDRSYLTISPSGYRIARSNSADPGFRICRNVAGRQLWRGEIPENATFDHELGLPPPTGEDTHLSLRNRENGMSPEMEAIYSTTLSHLIASVISPNGME